MSAAGKAHARHPTRMRAHAARGPVRIDSGAETDRQRIRQALQSGPAPQRESPEEPFTHADKNQSLPGDASHLSPAPGAERVSESGGAARVPSDYLVSVAAQVGLAIFGFFDHYFGLFARTSKVVSFTLKLRDEYVKAAYTLQDRKYFKAPLWLFRKSDRLSALHYSHPWAEPVAIEVRTLLGYLSGDVKTILRHIFWAQGKNVVDQLAKVAEPLVEEVFRKALASGTKDFAVIEGIVAAAFEDAWKAGRFFTTAKLSEPKLFTWLESRAKAAGEAKSAAAAGGEAAAGKAATAAERVGINAAREAAEQGALQAAKEARPGLLRRAASWTVSGVARLEKGLLSTFDRVGGRVADVVVGEIFTSDLQKTAAATIGKEVAAVEGRVAATVAREVTAKVVTRVLSKATAIGAVGSAAVTARKAYLNYEKGEKALAFVEALHAATDAAGVIPGVGVAVSLTGDVVFISVAYTIEKAQAVGKVVTWVRAQTRESLRLTPVEDRLAKLILIAEHASMEEDVQAFQRLYYSTPDKATADRIRREVEPHIGSSVNSRYNPMLRNILNLAHLPRELRESNAG